MNQLQRRGKISNAELAEAANLSASACHRRVQRLEAEGVIKDYVALLDARKSGFPTTVFVEITLSGQADEVLEAFEKAVSRIPDVLECHLMAGSADYLLRSWPKTQMILHASIANIWRACQVWHRCSHPLHCARCSKPRPCPFSCHFVD